MQPVTHWFVLFLVTTACAILLGCSSDAVQGPDSPGPADVDTPTASSSSEPTTRAPGRIVTVEPTPPLPPTAIPTAIPTATPVPRLARDPLTAEERGLQAALNAALLKIPAVAQVLAPIADGDAVALTSLIRPQVRYCEWFPDDYEPPPITEANAHIARCPESETSYDAWPVELQRDATRRFSPPATWNRSGTEELLEIVLSADVDVRSASVERYRRVLPNGQITLADRYLVTFALGPTDISGPSASLPAGGPAAFRIQIEAGDPRPIDGVEFLVGPAPRLTATVSSTGPPSQRDDMAGAATLAAINEIPAAAAVVSAFTAGDLEETLALFNWTERGCISPPLPGKEIPEVCDGLDLPPGSSYLANETDFGTIFPASKQRIEWWLSGLIAGDTPVVAAAWRIEGPWSGAEADERIVISFVTEPVSFIERDGQLAYWGDYLDGVWLHVDSGAQHPITFTSFFGDAQSDAQGQRAFEDSERFRATRLGAD